MSCTSATSCEAVGFSRSASGEAPLAEAWNGTSWQVQSVPAPAGQAFASLGGVSCASASFCSAVGSPSFAEMWDGTAWSLQAMPGSVGSVSCVSATFCAAVGSAGASGSTIWNGTSWTAQPVPSPSGATSADLGAVSCSSAQACEAVGSYSTSAGAHLSLAEAWNGASWAVQSTSDPAGAGFASLDAVSCAAAGACEAGGDFAQSPQPSDLRALAEAWDGSSWALQDAAAPAGATANSLNAVSCVSADFCEAVGTAGDSSGNVISLAETWNGTAWKVQPTPDPAQATSGVRGLMRGVSCVSADFCAAVGFSAAVPGAGAWTWNGTSWTAQAVAGSSSLESVSCTSADSCMAVGGNDEAVTWNGTAWSVQTTPLPADGNDIVLNAVSCVEASSCQAVGSYFTTTTFEQLTLAERWNGTTWAVRTTPNPPASTDNNLLGVWCSSADQCAAVGEQTPSVLSLTLAQVWNGTSWVTQSSSNRSKDDLNVLNSVWCGAKSSCTAVGIGADRGSIDATLVETDG